MIFCQTASEVFLERMNEVQNPLLKWMYQRETRITQKIEERLAAIASGVWTLTRHDTDYFTHVGKVGFVKAFELPASAVQPIAPSTPKTFDIGMIGGWIWKPNADGLHWFFEQVYPHLPTTISIQVAGRGADWLRDRYPNVTYWGFVEDARAFLSEARTIAIPSIRGGGIQIKSLEAIGLGLPIVATPFALRGIVQPPTTTVQLAETPEQFADCLQQAIAHTPTVADLESIQTWTRDRRARFLQDVDTALNAL
jgi:polysaccharide biosynthesis protein PslH